MPELGPYGSVRGARGNSRPYRESGRTAVKTTRMTQQGHWLCPPAVPLVESPIQPLGLPLE
jgi:hypothetical protein